MRKYAHLKTKPLVKIGMYLGNTLSDKYSPVMLLSPMIQEWFHFNIKFKGSTYLLFALSTVVFVYGGLPFLKGTKATR